MANIQLNGSDSEVTDNIILHVIKPIQVSAKSENEFWSSAFNYLEKNVYDGNVNEEFSAKFILKCLQSYGSSSANRTIYILKHYAEFRESSRTVSFFSSVLFEFYICDLHSEIQYVFSSGFTENVVYYADKLIQPNSMNLALEFADSSFSVCLIKYSLFSRMKIHYLELKTILSSFLEIW